MGKTRKLGNVWLHVFVLGLSVFVLACEPRDLPVLPEQNPRSQNQRNRNSSNRNSGQTSSNERGGSSKTGATETIGWEKDVPSFAGWFTVVTLRQMARFISWDENQFHGLSVPSCLTLGAEEIWLNGCSFSDRENNNAFWLVYGSWRMVNGPTSRTFFTEAPLKLRVTSGKKRLDLEWTFMVTIEGRGTPDMTVKGRGQLRWRSAGGLNQELEYLVSERNQSERRSSGVSRLLLLNGRYQALSDNKPVSYFDFRLEQTAWNGDLLERACQKGAEGGDQVSLGKFNVFYKPQHSIKDAILLLSPNQINLVTEKGGQVLLEHRLSVCEAGSPSRSSRESALTQLRWMFSPAMLLVE